MRVWLDENNKVKLAPEYSAGVVAQVQAAVDAILAGDFEEVHPDDED